jgi:hypothetical protein
MYTREDLQQAVREKVKFRAEEIFERAKFIAAERIKNEPEPPRKNRELDLD